MLENIYDSQSIPMSQKELNPLLASHERFAGHLRGVRAQLAGRKLDGLDFANRLLVEMDLSGASLVGASFYGSNLERASFYCADLRGCNLQAAKLVRADMRGASFRGANLSHAIMDGSDLRAARMMIVGPMGASITDRHKSGGAPDSASGRFSAGVDFSNCSLKNVSFGNAKLRDADFTGAILEGAKFKGATLKNVCFKGAVLTGVDLSELAVPAEALRDCILDVSPENASKSDRLKAMLESHERWFQNDGQGGTPAVLDGEDLRPLQGFVAARRLAGLSARGANAIGLNFAEAQLQAAKFVDADLRGADFSHCDLRGVSFRGANLSHAVFTKARLGSLKLAGGDVVGFDLSDATYSPHQLVDAHTEFASQDTCLV